MSVNLVSLSVRIKAARKAKGYTLDQLSAESGLAKGLLSKVENFRVTPSLQSIAKIAEALNISLSSLFEGLDETPSISVVRKDEKQLMERNSEESTIQYFDLAYRRASRKMNPFELVIPAKGGRKTLLAHEGEEFLTVVEGSAILEIDEQQISLQQGDSAYYDAETPHTIYNPTNKDAHLLCVFLEKGSSL